MFVMMVNVIGKRFVNEKDSRNGHFNWNHSMTIRLLFVCVLLMSSLVLAQNVEDGQELKNYAGTIGGHVKIGMTLIITNKDVVGTYFYNKWLQDILIKGSIEQRNIILNEFSKDGNIDGIFKGKFLNHAPEYGNRQIEYEVFEGVWSRQDGSGAKNFRLVMDSATYRPKGCGRYFIAGFSNDKTVEAFVKNFQQAVIAEDKKKVASMVAYPIHVNVRGKYLTITNKADFVRNHDRIFYKDFLERIKNAVPHNMFAKASGVMFGSKGEIWIGISNEKKRVIAINN